MSDSRCSRLMALSTSVVDRNDLQLAAAPLRRTWQQVVDVTGAR
ncbi:hypothetical protein Kfla_4496 [Kribbella flavida DSM 17836]|uniref:Uncharacterized protein n=1 Tax=Kribbella flavida (strain DSM 17836 / JCM 10339 / NBRC 14399) TaxID=479435 RepID=D2PWQ6_KRIFD|nr:hypothetical protein Kfla_4496 [Kribbella flavida DSM 17836]